jgi:hypothetical protein
VTYTKISPLGLREGFGTYDTMNDKEKHATMAEALLANEFVVIDLVQDSDGIIYFQAYHSKHIDDKLYFRLQWQHFPLGVDTRDDWAAMALGESLLIKYK